MNKIVISCIASILLLGACVNNQKDRLAYSADSTAVTEAPKGVSENIKPIDLDENIILNAGFKSENGFPTVVDFSATWCGPCKQFKPIFEEAKQTYAGKVDFLTIDVDSFPRISEKYGIEAVPTIIYFDAQGKEVNRTQGFIGKENFNVNINQLLNK